jgi:hemolysin III
MPVQPSSGTESPAIAKPSWRGWLHAAAFPIVAVAGFVLVATATTTAGQVSSAIFSATAALLFGVSALLHRGTWSPTVEDLLRRIDHANIYLIIAGTYTPFAVVALPPSEGKLLLSIVWTGALAGAAFRIFWTGAPRWLSTTLYVVVGWIVIFFLPELINGAGTAAVILIALGGVLYTVGAVVYGMKRPNPWPGTFGFHEVFHALTVAAFVTHYIAVWIVVH